MIEREHHHQKSFFFFFLLNLDLLHFSPLSPLSLSSIAGTPGGLRKIPEAAGLAVGAVFLVCLALFQHLHASGGVALLAPSSSSAASAPPPPPPALTSFFFGGKAAPVSSSSAPPATDAWLVDYNAALAAIAFMLLLGFADDVLDVPWRVRIFFFFFRFKSIFTYFIIHLFLFL